MVTSGWLNFIPHPRRQQETKMRAKEFTLNEGFWKDTWLRAYCERSWYEDTVNHLNKFISEIKRNNISSMFWWSLKTFMFYKGELVTCPNSSMNEQQRQLLKNLVDDIDMIIAHLPKHFLGGVNNTDINISKELINKVEQVIKLLPAFFGHTN